MHSAWARVAEGARAPAQPRSLTALALCQPFVMTAPRRNAGVALEIGQGSLPRSVP